MLFKRIVFVLFGALFLSIPSLVSAEEIDLGKIIVTASRIDEDLGKTSRKVDVVTAEEIESSGAENFTDILTPLTSVNMSDYGGTGGVKNIRMRGSSAQQVLVMVDGRPVNNPRDGSTDLTGIPLDNIDRVEVLHGPASSLYGSQAMGGAVNIITKRPPKEGRKFEILSSGGTYRSLLERFSYGERIGKFGYLLNTEYETSGGFRDNTEYDSKDFNGRFEYKLNDCHALNFNAGYFRDRAGTPGTITSPDEDDKQKNIKDYLDLSWVYKSENETGFELRTYRNEDRLEFIENTAGSMFDIPFDRPKHNTKVYGLNAQFNKLFFEVLQLITGFDYSKNLNNSTSSGKHQYEFYAGYVESQWEILERIKVSAGGRLDRYSNFGTQLDPSGSFLYQWSDQGKVRGSMSRSFRAPTFNDLYWPDEGWAKGNPSLKPEKGMTYELGTDYQINSNLSAGLTYYRNEFTDLINWAVQDGVWQPMNVNSAVIDGFEVENTIRLTNDLNVRIGYTFLKAMDAENHRYLTYQPKNKVDLAFKGKACYGIQFEWRGQFTDQRFADAENLTQVKRFFVMGLNLSKELKPGVRLFVTFENLADKHYQILNGYPMPGCSVNTGVKAEF